MASYKYSKEMIEFVLDRTVPDHPVPRGRRKALYAETAEEFNRKFTALERPVGYAQIKYITDHFGDRTEYDNRKGSVIYPADTAKDNTSGPSHKTATENRPTKRREDTGLTICPHCNGKGYLDTSGTEQAADSSPSQLSRVGGVDSPSHTPQRASEPLHSDSSRIEARPDPYRGVRPPAGVPAPPAAATNTSRATYMPNYYGGISQFGTPSRPPTQYQEHAPAAPAAALQPGIYGGGWQSTLMPHMAPSIEQSNAAGINGSSFTLPLDPALLSQGAMLNGRQPPHQMSREDIPSQANLPTQVETVPGPNRAGVGSLSKRVNSASQTPVAATNTGSLKRLRPDDNSYGGQPNNSMGHIDPHGQPPIVYEPPTKRHRSDMNENPASVNGRNDVGPPAGPEVGLGNPDSNNSNYYDHYSFPSGGTEFGHGGAYYFTSGPDDGTALATAPASAEQYNFGDIQLPEEFDIIQEFIKEFGDGSNYPPL